MDLKDFFDTVTPNNCKPVVDEYAGKFITKENAPGSQLPCNILRNRRGEPNDRPALHALFVDGCARQGIPTSPMVANIAAADMDWRIETTCRGLGVMFTRYADDLTFSFNDPSLRKRLMELVFTEAQRKRFRVNRRKTHFMSATQGRRIITGVAVDDAIHPTRKLRRKMRAAAHQCNWASLDGMREWAKLKLPKGFVEEDKRGRQAWTRVSDDLYGKF